jgi:dTDP-glucose 4,6-dehydratase/UDP-glucose 4,6-dehydratase
MKFLIYGSNGWIGQQLIRLLEKESLSFVKGVSRVDEVEQVTQEIEDVCPTHVLCLMGRTHGKIGDKVYPTIDYLEQGKERLYENIRDNLFSPILLAELCQRKNIHYTYLGTGCIFNFDETHDNGFTEDDAPNFFGSSYSIVKGFTDRLMHLHNVLNLRIRMPISDEKNTRNFITKITTYEKICSIPNSMTVLPELLPYVIDMMKKKMTGTMNLTNPGLISHGEILKMYQEIVDPSFTWKEFSQEEQRLILAADRSNNYLDTTRLESLYPVQSIHASVRDCLLRYKNSLPVQAPVLLVTGGCGFIGSHFINSYFPKKKPTLVNLDALYYCASIDNVDRSIQEDPHYTFVKGNVGDAPLVSDILDRYQITHVIHFAAQSHVQNSFENSISFTQDNILGTHVLLECCRKYGKIVKFIHVSTDEVYGESMNTIEETHKTEHSILCPTNPYAATKSGAELIAQSYHHSYQMPVIITRGNNVYGPRQYHEKLIPRFIKLLQEDKKVTVQGDGSSVRAFLHVSDTVKAFECILEKGKIGEIYNIGCDDQMEYSVMDIAKILIERIKPKDPVEDWIEYVKDRPFNDKRYYISNQKLKNLGWKIEIGFKEGLNTLFLNASN